MYVFIRASTNVRFRTILRYEGRFLRVRTRTNYQFFGTVDALEMSMKEDVDVADEMSLSCSKRNLVQSVPKCTYLQFMVLEGKDCDKNLHEGEHGCCRRNEIIYNKMILTL